MSDESIPIDWAKLKEELKASGVLPMNNKVITVVMPDARWSRVPASLMTSLPTVPILFTWIIYDDKWPR